MVRVGRQCSWSTAGEIHCCKPHLHAARCFVCVMTTPSTAHHIISDFCVHPPVHATAVRLMRTPESSSSSTSRTTTASSGPDPQVSCVACMLLNAGCCFPTRSVDEHSTFATPSNHRRILNQRLGEKLSVSLQTNLLDRLL